MGKRITTEGFIERAQKVHGDKYDYSKVEYIDNRTPVCIICPIHGEFWQTPHDHLRRHGCQTCGGSQQSNTQSFINKANSIHENKYDYSKVNYINTHTKVCIICPEHGEFWQTPHDHLRGQGCPKCAIMKRARSKTLTTTDFIIQAQKVHGNKYDYSKTDLSKRTKDGKILITCPKHGDFWQTPNNHLKGYGCKLCGDESTMLKRRKTLVQFVKESQNTHGIKKYNYENSNYVNARTPIKIFCNTCKTFFEQTPHMHLQGQGCPNCAKQSSAEKRRKDIQDFIDESSKIHNVKYDYSKAEYINNKTKVCIICPEHGEFWQLPSKHLHGEGCPKCTHQQSKPEQEIIEYLKQFLKPEQIKERDRELLDGREVDILLPDFHIGIEYNGLYWHNFEHKPDINYHRDKMLLANSKGYRLIQIFEDEWLEHKNIVLNKLRHVINADMREPTIGARKCTVRQINKQIANDFLNTYHIQGFVGSSIYLGAYYGEELVGVMTFKEEKPKMWNLSRFATKTDYKLPGLASKMFKYFTKNNKFDEIKSFLDLRWNQSLGENTLYDRLGFVLEENIRPDYRYIVGSQRIHKFRMRKQPLHKKYSLPLTMTEREMCNELGFQRIYDCGLAKYVYKNEKNNNNN